MRYILNDEGYIEEISFLHEIECNNKTCTEYTGTIPEGYSSLAEWSEIAVIQAYKIVDGNLTYDPDKETALETDWKTHKITDFMTAGVLTTGQTQIIFNITMDEKINGEIERLELTKCQIRHADGGYIANGVDLSTLGTIAYALVSTKRLKVTLTLNTAATFTNNCPVTVWVLNGAVILK